MEMRGTGGFFSLLRARADKGDVRPVEIRIGRGFVGLVTGIALLAVILELSGRMGIDSWRSPAEELRLNPLASELRDKSCRAYDDPLGTVHLLAASDLDAAACFGWAHARDRAWQMDFFRRIARARSAEVFGWRSLRSDFIMSLLELEHHARRIFAEMEPEHRRLLWAYSYGVNRALIEVTRRGGVPELRELRTEMSGWHPVDTLALLLLQSFDQTRKGFEADIGELDRLAALGPDLERLNRPDGLPWDVSVLKSGEYPLRRSRGGGPRRVQDDEETSTARLSVPDGFNELRALRTEPLPRRPSAGEGSNNWVLAPSRGKGGRAWLANDPHLALTRPGFWHWVHVKGAELDVIGASFPGIPIVVSGANRKVAWGLTNAYLDAADVVRVNGAAARSQGEWRRPWIPVRVGVARLPFFFRRYLRLEERFPVLPLDADEQGRVLALRWSGFSLTGDDLGSIFDIMKVKDVKDADAALSRVGVPTWNFVFADVEGGIGYRAVGRIPRRLAAPPAGAHELEADGSIGWGGARAWLTPEEMPHALNPGRGFLVTANNRQWPSDAALHGGRAYAPGFRAFRAEELLEKIQRHDLDSIARVQCDVQAVDLRFLVPALLELFGDDEEDGVQGRTPAQARVRDAIERLRAWSAKGEFLAALDCVECGVARRWVERLEEKSLLEPAGNYRLARIAERHPIEPHSIRFRAWVADSLGQALSDLGPDPWRPWGMVHHNPFTALNASVDVRPSTGFPLSTPGDENSVNPGTSVWDESSRSWRQTHGASQRLVVELTDPPTIHVQLAGENRPLTPVWNDATAWERWSRCALTPQIFPLDFGAPEVSRHLETVVF